MFGFVKKLMPTRQKFTEAATQAVADLDAMLVEPVSFKLHGKMHLIKPLSVEQFMVLSASLVDIVELQKQNSITPKELIDKYYALISNVCDSVKRSDIEQMSQQQVSALFNLVIETVTGKIFVEKKSPAISQAI